jgi:hypothetical protein
MPSFHAEASINVECVLVKILDEASKVSILCHLLVCSNGSSALELSWNYHEAHTTSGGLVHPIAWRREGAAGRLSLFPNRPALFSRA